MTSVQWLALPENARLHDIMLESKSRHGWEPWCDKLRLGVCDGTFISFHDDDGDPIRKTLLCGVPRCMRPSKEYDNDDNLLQCSLSCATACVHCGGFELDPCALGSAHTWNEGSRVNRAARAAGGCCWALPTAGVCTLLMPTLLATATGTLAACDHFSQEPYICPCCEEGDPDDILLAYVPACWQRGEVGSEKCSTLNGAVYVTCNFTSGAVVILPFVALAVSFAVLALPCIPLAVLLRCETDESEGLSWQWRGRRVEMPKCRESLLSCGVPVVGAVGAPLLLPLILATPLAFGAAAGARHLAALSGRVAQTHVEACVPGALLPAEADTGMVSKLQGCTLGACSLGLRATLSALFLPCLAGSAALRCDGGDLRLCGRTLRVPEQLDADFARCAVVLPVTLPFAALATCALAGIKAVETGCALASRARKSCGSRDVGVSELDSDDVERALRLCKDPRTVAQLRASTCEWDADAQAVVVDRAGEPPLVLDTCLGFPRLRVDNGAVVIVVHSRKHALPEDTHVEGNLLLVGSHSMTWDLPRGLSVGGNLYVRDLVPARPLERVSVGGQLLLHFPDDTALCVRLMLGPGNVVGGGLYVHRPTQDDEPQPHDESLPRDALELAAGESEVPFALTLRSPSLSGLPQNLLRVHGNLILDGCAELTSLPAGLVVDGDLSVRRCKALAALPEDLEVRGSLFASECDLLGIVPESLRVGGREMDFGSCNMLFQLPLLPLLQPRQELLSVNVSGTCILGEALEALLALESTSIQIVHDDDISHDDSPSHEDDAGSVLSLEDAERNFGVSAWALRNAIDPAYVRGVLRFLDKLLRAADARDTNLRDGLVARTHEILQLVIDDAEAREELVLRMCDSVDACADKPAWALGQMQLVAMIARARGDRERLRVLGRGVMRLDIVHDHATRYTEQRQEDDVSVMLRFKIALRESLQLPVSTQTMLYAAPVPAEVLACAEEEALSVSKADFARWLETWEEWRRQRRLEAVVPYAQLLPFGGEMQDADDDADERPRDPVYALPDTANVWSYAGLCAHWVRTGMDFSGGVIGVDDFVGSVVRRLSEDVAAAARVTLRESLRRRLSIFAKTSQSKSGGAQLAPAPQEAFER